MTAVALGPKIFKNSYSKLFRIVNAVERGTVRVKCLVQEHNTMFPARDRTRTARSGVEHTNHEPTAQEGES